jgi:hypothetical protein
VLANFSCNLHAWAHGDAYYQRSAAIPSDHSSYEAVKRRARGDRILFCPSLRATDLSISSYQDRAALDGHLSTVCHMWGAACDATTSVLQHCVGRTITERPRRGRFCIQACSAVLIIEKTLSGKSIVFVDD